MRITQITTVPQTLIFLRAHCAHLRERGYSLHVVSSPGEMLDRFAAEERIPAHGVAMARQMRPLADLVSLARLCEALDAIRPDIVHCHTPKAGLLGTLAARLMGVPAVALSVFGLPQMTRRGPIGAVLNATTRLSCALADRVWCDSPSMRDHLIAARLCRADKVFVLGHGSVGGVDSGERFCPARFSAEMRASVRARHGIEPDELVLGFVGRLVRDKGLLELETAWRSLRQRHAKLHLLLVGPEEAADGLPVEVLERLRGDAHVHRAGMVDDVPSHLAMMDLFVNPSHREGFGVANAEASSMGLAVVATRIPGCVDSVADGETGTLVPPRDAQALALAIDRYLNDRELAAAHGAAGRRRIVRCFQPHDYWHALEEVYCRLARRPDCPQFS